MKKFLKWVGIVLGILAGLVAIGLVIIYVQSESRLTHVYEIPAEQVVIPTDAASIENGKHIFQFRGCEACHGENLEGTVYLDDPAVGKVISSNLTSGLGGVGSAMSDSDWVRAIRHGIRPNGTAYLFMPSTEFYYLSDDDLGDVIAYIKSVAPVDNDLPASEISFTGRIVMTLVKDITFIPAELIPHDSARPTAPKAGTTPEYGAYLTQSCHVCHGLNMSGGVIPGFPSTWPPAPNITFGGGSALPTWTEEEFMNTIRTGKTPQGKELRAAYMPWNSYKFMSDDELKAVWAYLQSLPRLEYGNR
ncbi:MAG TPA: cytochrome c [Anaerolineales bacterium]|nr:cytochrome c [Anaerolineales bacterium]HMX18056.1 cytochrome c [Anaerolineales bacterium]HNA52787.1 cytochrome c [Anaerolineales bacterium]HNC87341.1 cytochrome c [Anaerolineales bacterium]HND91810.1 cytochrome c [Anaerolineales bacterium]